MSENSAGGIPTASLNKIAEAIWRVYNSHEADCCDFAKSLDPNYYRGLAQAAVDALGLTQEWKTVHESGGGYIHHSYAKAREEFDSFVERPPGFEDPGSGRLTHIAERFVSPWVVVGHPM